jgi:hypothetical protein
MKRIIKQIKKEWLRKTIVCFLCVFFFYPVFSQDPVGQPAPEDPNKTKFMGKIGHWLAAYGISGDDFMQQKRNEFKTAAFAEVYIEATIDYDTWMFNLLNRVTKLKYEAKQTPYIVFEIKFKPKDDKLDSYQVFLTLQPGSAINPNQDKVVSGAAAHYLTGKTYAEPAKAGDDIESALTEALNGLAAKLGNSLAPNLMVRYQNEVFWNGHEIPILDQEGNSVELEATDKAGKILNPNDVTWTNADPFQSKGVVDMTGVASKSVTLTKKADSTRLTVTVKRVNASDDINALLKMLIVEVLTAKKQQAVDTLPKVRVDSVNNANDLIRQIKFLEAGNFPVDNVGAKPIGLFTHPPSVSVADSLRFIEGSERSKGFEFLIKRKKLRNIIWRKVNVVALANLVVDHPEKVNDLLDALLLNSGRLVARLILNKDSQGKRDAARNIVTDFLNQNLEKIAGSQFGPPPPDPPLPSVVPPAQPFTFSAEEPLYVSPMVAFEGKQLFIDEMKTYLRQLNPRVYVVVNYSQDVTTENYINRVEGTRPAGLASGQRYINITLVNIPGSVKSNITISLDQGDARHLEPDNKINVAEKLTRAIKDNSVLQTVVSLDIFKPLMKDGHYVFLNPAGKVVTVPDNTTEVVFSTYDRFFSKDYKAVSTSPAIGSLSGFTIGNKVYTATASNGQFTGYQDLYSGVKDDYYFDELSAQVKPDKGIALITTVEGGNFIGYGIKCIAPNSEIKYHDRGTGPLRPSLFISDLSTTELTLTVKEYVSKKAPTGFIRVTDLRYLTNTPFAVLDSKTGLKADDYLKSVVDENSILSVVLAQFALVYQTPEAIAAFKSCDEDNKASLWLQIRGAVDQHLKQLHQITESGGYVGRSTVDVLQEELINVSVKSLAELENGAALTSDVAKATSIEQVAKAIEVHYSSCAFKSLNASTRKKILEWLITNDTDYWSVHDKNIIFDLILTAPDDQIVAILKGFYEKNYSWLYLLWDKGDFDYSSQVIDALVAKLGPKFKEVGVATTSDENIYFEDFEQSSLIVNPVGNKPYFIGLDNDETFQITRDYSLTLGIYSKTGKISFSESGKIRFEQNYSINDTRPTYQNNDAIFRKDRSVSQVIDFEIGAFEPVTIYFARNYATLGVEKGKPYVVPAIWALRISESADDVVFNENLRTGINILAIGLAFESFGQSLTIGVFLSQLAGVASAIDVGIQANIKTLTPAQYASQAAYFESWDNFYTAVTVADGAYALSKIVTVKGLATKWNSFTNLVRNPAQVPAVIKGAWVSVKGFKVGNLFPRNLIDDLTGGLKDFHNRLVSNKGLVAEIQGQSILYRNSAYETVAIITNNKITPVKWTAAYKHASKIETEAGYWMVKEGDDVLLDLGFKEGRTVDAVQANDYLVNSGRAQKEGQPYVIGTPITEEVLQEGATVRFVENFNGGAPNPGGFGTKDPITTIGELRENLAVLEEWKPTSLTPTLRTYRVKKPLRTRSGYIGPQLEKTGPNAGKTYKGGSHQYEFIDDLRGGNWKNYLEEVVPGGGVKLLGGGVPRGINELNESVGEWVNLQRQLANSNRELREFNTATVVYNKFTGRHYYGANRGIFVKGDEIHSTLAANLPEVSTNNFKLGNCAECDAVNQALTDGSKWSDLQMHTVGVEFKTGNTFPKPLCSNCEVTFKGIEITD